VIFTGYFDEADTHGPAPTVILAGYVGHAYQWRRFEKKLERIQRHYGFKIFHAKDFKAGTGEFAGWPVEKGGTLIKELTGLVRATLTEGITISLERDRYEKEYRAPPIPKKMRLDSQYGVCFRACLGRLLDVLAKRDNRDHLHIVFEDGHKNVRDCKRIFDDIQKRLQRSGTDILDSFTIKNKTNCLPLMMADFLAAAHSMMKEAVKKGEIKIEDILQPTLPPGDRGIAFLELAPDALKNLKIGFQRMRQLEIEDWRAKRAARRASSLAGRQPS
jgi:hypothetical protein